MAAKQPPSSHVVVYITPNIDYTTEQFYKDKPAVVSGIAIGVWVTRHDQWMIKLTIPVSVDVHPVQLHVN